MQARASSMSQAFNTENVENQHCVSISYLLTTECYQYTM